MDAKQKVLVAGALILVWAGLAVSQWNMLEEPARVPLTNVTGFATGDHQLESREGGLHVNLSLLAATAKQRDAPYTISRNIFTMTPIEEPPFVNSEVGVASLDGTSATEALTEQEGGVEAGQFRYLGFLRIGDGSQGHKSVAVLRKDDDILVLKTGDRIDDRLVLKKITPDHVTVRDPGSQLEQTVELSEEVGVQE